MLLFNFIKIYMRLFEQRIYKRIILLWKFYHKGLVTINNSILKFDKF